MQTERPAVRMSGVSFRYPRSRQWVLHDVNLTVYEDEVIGIIGPSGAGKSTLLKLLAGLEAPSAGAVVRERPSAGGFVFQSPVLLDWLRVIENVIFPGRPPKADVERAEQLIAAVGLTEARNLYPRQLSGGMRSRVQLARALFHSPSILYLDEAFSSVDETMRRELNRLFLELQQALCFSAVVISHSVREAVHLCDRIFRLEEKGDGTFGVDAVPSLEGLDTISFFEASSNSGSGTTQGYSQGEMVSK